MAQGHVECNSDPIGYHWGGCSSNYYDYCYNYDTTSNPYGYLTPEVDLVDGCNIAVNWLSGMTTTTYEEFAIDFSAVDSQVYLCPVPVNFRFYKIYTPLSTSFSP